MSVKKKVLVSSVSVIAALAIAAGVTLGVLQPWRSEPVLESTPQGAQTEVVEETPVILNDGTEGIMTMSARAIPQEEYSYYNIETTDVKEHYEITPVLKISTDDGYGKTAIENSDWLSVNTDLIDIAYYTWTIDWMEYTGDENVNSAQGSYSYSQGDESIKSATGYDGVTKWYVHDGYENETVSSFIKFTTKEMYSEEGGFNGEKTGSETPEEETFYDISIDSESEYESSSVTTTDYTEGWTYDVAAAYTVGNTLAIPSVLAEIDLPYGTPIGLTLTVVDYGGNEISATIRFDYMAKLTSDNFTVYSGVKDGSDLTNESGQVTLGDNGDSYQELFSACYHEAWSDTLVDGDVEDDDNQLSKDDKKLGTAHDAYFEVTSVNGIAIMQEQTDDTDGSKSWGKIDNALDDYDQAVTSSKGDDDTYNTDTVTYAYASYDVAAQEGATIFFEESDATWSTGTVYTSTKTWNEWSMKVSYGEYTHTASMNTSTAGADDAAMAETTSWNGDSSITKTIFSGTNTGSGITTLGTPVQGLRYSDLRTFDRSMTTGVLSTALQSDAEAMMTIEFYWDEDGDGNDNLMFSFSFSFNDYESIRVDASEIQIGNDEEGSGVTAGVSGGTTGSIVAG